MFSWVIILYLITAWTNWITVDITTQPRDAVKLPQIVVCDWPQSYLCGNLNLISHPFDINQFLNAVKFSFA